MFEILMIVLITLVNFQVSTSYGIVRLHLLTFADPEGLVHDGKTCGDDGCDVKVIGCMSTHGIPDEKKKCDGRQFVSTYNVTFKDQPIEFLWKESWLGNLGIFILINNVVSITVSKMIDEHSRLLPINISIGEPTYHNYTLIGNVSTLNISITAQCTKDYYGSDCTKYCVIKGKKKQFCNQTTGLKQCMKDYYGVNCTKYCKPNITVGHFVCNRSTGDKICSKDYYGKDCVTYCKNPSGNSHYTCNRTTGVKICFPGWGGVECNIPLLTPSIVSTQIHLLSTLYYTTILPTSTKTSTSFTYVFSVHPSVFHSSIKHSNTSLVLKRKSGRWITSTVGGVTTLCVVVVICVTAVVLFVMLLLQDRKRRKVGSHEETSKKDPDKEENSEINNVNLTMVSASQSDSVVYTNGFHQNENDDKTLSPVEDCSAELNRLNRLS